MRFFLLLVLAAATLTATEAACANDCSGHGTCNVYSACECYRNWMAADCSERVCYFGHAFVDTPQGDLNADGRTDKATDTYTVILGSTTSFFQDDSGNALTNWSGVLNGRADPTNAMAAGNEPIEGVEKSTFQLNDDSATASAGYVQLNAAQNAIFWEVGLDIVFNDMSGTCKTASSQLNGDAESDIIGVQDCSAATTFTAGGNLASVTGLLPASYTTSADSMDSGVSAVLDDGVTITVPGADKVFQSGDDILDADGKLCEVDTVSGDTLTCGASNIRASHTVLKDTPLGITKALGTIAILAASDDVTRVDSFSSNAVYDFESDVVVEYTFDTDIYGFTETCDRMQGTDPDPINFTIELELQNAQSDLNDCSDALKTASPNAGAALAECTLSKVAQVWSDSIDGAERSNIIRNYSAGYGDSATTSNNMVVCSVTPSEYAVQWSNKAEWETYPADHGEGNNSTNGVCYQKVEVDCGAAGRCVKDGGNGALRQVLTVASATYTAADAVVQGTATGTVETTVTGTSVVVVVTSGSFEAGASTIAASAVTVSAVVDKDDDELKRLSADGNYSTITTKAECDAYVNPADGKNGFWYANYKCTDLPGCAWVAAAANTDQWTYGQKGNPAGNHGVCRDACASSASTTAACETANSACQLQVTIPKASYDEAHFYRECSNKGMCNRSSGQCECFAGYVGEGCTRTQCPNDCSGHGVCKRAIDGDATYMAWDAYKTQACECDAGYAGADCSLRNCPFGDDPITRIDDVAEIQSFGILGDDNAHAAGSLKALTSQYSNAEEAWFALEFTDEQGDKWVTRSIDFLAADVAADVEAALEALPNGVIEDVEVSLFAGSKGPVDNTGTTNGGAVTYAKGRWVSVTFTHNSGDVPDLGARYDWRYQMDCGTRYSCINSADDNANAAQSGVSRITNMPDGSFGDVGFVLSKGTLNTPAAIMGNKENAPCSNRGMCDYSTGVCKCFAGFTDFDCSVQNALSMG